MTQRRARTAILILMMVLVILMIGLATGLLGIYLVSGDRDRMPEKLNSVMETSQTAETTAFSSGSVPETIQAPVTGREEKSISETAPVVIILDPGHGLGDPGCDSDYLEGTEAETVLEMALLMKEKLEQQGATVYLTHDGSTYPGAAALREQADQYGLDYQSERLLEDDCYSPYERTVYGAVQNAVEQVDLFLSLHVNALPEHPEVGRYEIYYCAENPYAERLAILASSLAAVFQKETMTEGTRYEDAFITTKYASYPSLLLEIGYATNPEDAENLNSQAWRETFCDNVIQEIYLWLQSG